MTAALLLMDYQGATCDVDDPLGADSGLAAEATRREVLRHAARCLDAARGAGMAVLHCHLAWDATYRRRTNRSAMFDQYERGGLMIEGSPEATIRAEVAPRAGEHVLAKSGVDPFVGTPLLGMLVAGGVSQLFLGGVATNFVVESAARHAGDLGFDVCVLEDLCSSFTQEAHDFAITTTLPA